MELKISSPSPRILLEKVDNGIILYEIGEDNVVTSKMVHSLYFHDGIIDFEAVGSFMIEMMETLKVPIIEPETNRKLEIYITKIDPNITSIDDADEEKEDPDDEND